MSSDKQRAALLSDLWDAQAKAMLDILKGSEPGEVRGSTLKEIRQFLLDNGVTIETVVKEQAQEQLMEDLEEQYPGLPSPEDLDLLTR